MELSAARADVWKMIRAGMAFDVIEAEIDQTPLSDDQKAALWLYAWTLLDQGRQRHLAPTDARP
jgi:hypothetical protein